VDRKWSRLITGVALIGMLVLVAVAGFVR